MGVVVWENLSSWISCSQKDSKFLRKHFLWQLPGISALKRGIFLGLQIRQAFVDRNTKGLAKLGNIVAEANVSQFSRAGRHMLQKQIVLLGNKKMFFL